MGTLTRAASCFAGLFLVGCPPAEEATCADLCRNLQTCGLLPSVLGAKSGEDMPPATAQENCSERCARTPEDDRRPMLDCRINIDIETFDWCGMNSGCADLGACLVGKFPGVPITGKSGIQVEAWNPTCASAEKTPKVGVDFCEAGEPSGIPGGCPWSGQAEEACSGRDDSIQAFVTQGQARTFGAARSCSAGLSQHTAFEGLTPGRVTAGLRITSQESARLPPDAGTGGAAPVDRGPRCTEFVSDVVLSAGRHLALVPVLLPNLDSGRSCEICDDEVDNDDDGVVDCKDNDCLVECAQKTAPTSEPTGELPDGGMSPGGGADG